jgi:hypothetical protein
VNVFGVNGLAMKAFAVQAAVAALATGGSSLCCALAASLLVGAGGGQAALAAGAISFPVALAVLVFFFRRGVTPESVVVGTLLRMALTVAVAGALVLVCASLRTPAFFLSLGMVYLANLSVETWFAFERAQRARRV